MRMIKTGIDDIVDYLQKGGSSGLAELSERFGYPENVIETWLNALEGHDDVEIHYNLTDLSVKTTGRGD